MDDGLRRGDEVFEKQMSKLEAKFPFESKKDTSVHIHWCSKALAKASQCLKASMLARLSQFIYIYERKQANMPDGLCHFRRETQSPSINWQLAVRRKQHTPRPLEQIELPTE